ncbi:hypothetical protein KY284_020559 [Solanum tuberosum]|nr:hypothetical protein KY284_020559 [Solanum tuberosum]
MASSSNTTLALSPSSLHQLIAICSIKLKPLNYLVCRIQVLQLIHTLKIDEIIKGELPSQNILDEKDEPIPNPKFTTWEDHDVLVRSWLSGTMTEESIFLIIGCTTVKQIWACLEDTYLQASKDKEFQLKQQLQAVKLGTKSIDEYIKEFKGICHNLMAIHKPSDEDSKFINFARGLGSNYKTLRTVMLRKAPYPTFNQFVNALRGLKMREDGYEEEAPPSLDPSMAFMTQKWQRRECGGSYYRGRGGKRGIGRSYNQKQYNTTQNEGNQQKESSKSNSCQICGRNNHTTLSCFYRWDYSYQAQQQVPQVLASMSFSDQIDNNLYMDSGASNHMVQSKGPLLNSTPFKGYDFVRVGNGDKLRITHVGNKHIGRNLRLKDVFVVPNLKKNLISVSKFVKDNVCSLKFTDEGFIVKDKRTKTILEKGNMRHNMYTLEGNLHESLTATKAEKNSDSIWHQ